MKKYTPKTIDKPALCFWGLTMLKFLLFNLMWCLPTTFVPFSTLEMYTSAILVSLLLVTPYKFFRLWKTEIVVMLLLDALLVANLMYFRTYYTAIPLSSYALSVVSNLTDFKASVSDSLRWTDLLFPLTSLAAIPLYHHYRRQASRHGTLFIPLFATSLLLLVLTTAIKGGFAHTYNKMRQKAYLCSSGAALYTVFGSLAFDLLAQDEELTPEINERIGRWLSRQPAACPPDSTLRPRRHCIVILAESFESWVLDRRVEGQEITPHLNRLLADSTTLYAPHMLSQVKGGRSIDAQLLLCGGLLPIQSGTYASLYPDHTYYTLQKALKQRYGSRSYLLTIDKLSTWNQGVIAQSFGTDTLIAYRDFELEEAFGTHRRTGDGSFFEQCREKMERNELWPEGESVYMQFVTYSGHAPFVLPKELREVHFSDSIPRKVADYMTTARYTDHAIGRFVEYLKSRPEYRDMLIVITGDHERLARYRKPHCEPPAGRGLVSPHQYTPFIVLNSPVGLRYEGVCGQIDMYPTLLTLLGLDDYPWHGLGQSLLDPAKPAFAVSPHDVVEGVVPSDSLLQHAREAYDISDLIIRYNYLDKLEK